MKPHDHDHAHGDPHAHGHEAHQHHEPAATSSTTAHHHPHARSNPHTGRHEQPFSSSLLMTSSWSRVLGALALIALLWLAVAWAVLTP
jgi:hypothetical protein